MKKFLALFCSLLLSISLYAQQVEMADRLRADGKIYVVVLVMSIILLGILFYLWRLDAKLTKLEKEFPRDEA